MPLSSILLIKVSFNSDGIVRVTERPFLHCGTEVTEVTEVTQKNHKQSSGGKINQYYLPSASGQCWRTDDGPDVPFLKPNTGYIFNFVLVATMLCFTLYTARILLEYSI